MSPLHLSNIQKKTHFKQTQSQNPSSPSLVLSLAYCKNKKRGIERKQLPTHTRVNHPLFLNNARRAHAGLGLQLGMYLYVQSELAAGTREGACQPSPFAANFEMPLFEATAATAAAVPCRYTEEAENLRSSGRARVTNATRARTAACDRVCALAYTRVCKRRRGMGRRYECERKERV